MSENTDTQAAFVELAKERLADPMVTDGPRDESTLDPFFGDNGEPSEFDEAPGDFENDVLARLENMENAIDGIIEGNAKTHDAIVKIVSMVETISGQVEPVMAQVMESKLFRMFVPAKKGGA